MIYFTLIQAYICRQTKPYRFCKAIYHYIRPRIQYYCIFIHWWSRSYVEQKKKNTKTRSYYSIKQDPFFKIINLTMTSLWHGSLFKLQLKKKHLKTIKTLNRSNKYLMCQLNVYSHRTKYSCDVMLFILYSMLILWNYG